MNTEHFFPPLQLVSPLRSKPSARIQPAQRSQLFYLAVSRDPLDRLTTGNTKLTLSTFTEDPGSF